MVRFTSSHVKPALKGEVDASVTSRRRGCIEAAVVYVNPSVTAYAVPAPRRGEPFSLPPTKSCPRLRGKCRGVAVTKGEWLKLPSNFTISPQLRLRSAAPPFHGGAFYRASSILFKNSSSGAKRRLCSLPLRRNMSVCEDFALSVLSAPARVKGMPSR